MPHLLKIALTLCVYGLFSNTALRAQGMEDISLKRSTESSTTGTIQLVQTAILPDFLGEISGHCFSSQGLWMINDGGNPSTLFFLPHSVYTRWRDSGMALTDSFFIGFELPFANRDWEALESDGEFLYVGDFGNNLGTRQDLCIFKISIRELFKQVPHLDTLLKQELDLGIQNSLLLREAETYKGIAVFNKNTYRKVVIPDSTLRAERIEFYYPQQKKFKARRLHAYDCEAMLIDGTRLLLLSKNWNNLRCDVYELPNQAGRHRTNRIGGFRSGFLVTDAIFRDSVITVCGYGPSGRQYLGKLDRGTFENFQRIGLWLKPGQVEGISWDSQNGAWLLSTESRKSQRQGWFLIRWE